MIKRIRYVLVGSFFASAAFADGLVFQLPADGSWARFGLKGELIRQNNTNPFSGTVILRSVGKIEESGEKCRWVEIELLLGDDKTIYKLLVPEKGLKKGENPLAQSIRAWIQHASDAPEKLTEPHKAPFLPALLGAPLSDAKTLEDQEIENAKLGMLKCKRISGKRKQERDDGLVIESTHELCLHEKAPFGAVAAKIDFAGKRGMFEDFRGSYSITFEDSGANAKSELPEFK